ncbi:prephenate dehydratase [Phnomibacter sp. MR]|uniref:prephenate dehydratase n=1 Tax=Phnomibacter sp. MR TaxID=3042318 RepID=UPI003A805B7E
MKKATNDAAPQHIAIQGYEGSFHQEAARRFFGKQTVVIPCDTFRQVIQHTVSRHEASAGMMAIENSIAGSILPNYTLLQKHPVKIIGEVYLHIKQHLLANKGVKLEDIKEVQSHPMAILQCMEYLETQPQFKLMETEDTALSARHVAQRKSKYQAAIAGKLAAELYNLDILVPNIHTQKNNYTRFLVLKHEKEVEPVEGADKASLKFHTDHSRGSLAKALAIIADAGINLSKLQSMPIPGTEFMYSFYADMEFGDLNQLNKMLKKLEKATESVTLFGIYKNGKLS